MSTHSPGLGHVVGEQADVDHPLHPADVHLGQVGPVGQVLDQLTRDTQAHRITIPVWNCPRQRSPGSPPMTAIASPACSEDSVTDPGGHQGDAHLFLAGPVSTTAQVVVEQAQHYDRHRLIGAGDAHLVMALRCGRPGNPIVVDGTHISTVGQLWEDVQRQADSYDRLRSTLNSAVTSSRSLSAPKKPVYGLIPKADWTTGAVPR